MDTRVHQAPPKKKRKRRHLSWKWLFVIPVFLIVAYFTLFLLVVPERAERAFFQGDDRPVVIAHRGGAELSPENTLIAFEKAVQLGVDILEMDVHLSADGHVMVIHDDDVKHTTNGEGLVYEMDLADLKQLDAAHAFDDVRGYYIYRGHGVRIPTLEQVFEAFPNTRMMIEMKHPEYMETDVLDSYDIERALWEIIEQFDAHDRVIVSSFSERMTNRFNAYAQESVVLAASQEEAQRFVFLHKTFLERIYHPQVDSLQLPMQSGVFNLTEQRLIDGAHRLNMPIYYWTINEEEDMRMLLERGVDGIITDRPDRLLRVRNEMDL